MVLMAIGVNHQTAPIEIREKFAFDEQRRVSAVRQLLNEGLIEEGLVLSTCNRTELYCLTDGLHDPFAFLINQKGVNYNTVGQFTYSHSDVYAVRHLMRVAAGLDSMVLGEAEIFGQIKGAFQAALQGGTIGKHIDRLFQSSFAAAKEARSCTDIGKNPISIAFAAAKLSEHIFTDLQDATVLLVGAGNLIQLTGRHLKELGVKRILIANRSLDAADLLAQELQGEVCQFSDIPEKLPSADIVIAATASSLPILGKGMIESAIKKRKRKPMFMVDLGMPRNIEPEAKELEDIYLYCIDDLQNIVEENIQSRKEAAIQAEGIIENSARQFIDWLHAQDSFKILSQFRKKFEDIRDQIIKDNLNHLKSGVHPEQVITRLAHTLTNRFLHEPTRRLRTAAFDKEQELLALTKDLFELNYEILDIK